MSNNSALRQSILEYRTQLSEEEITPKGYSKRIETLLVGGICPFSVATLGWLLEKNKWDSLAKQYRAPRELFDKAIKIVGNENVNIDVRRRTPISFLEKGFGIN